MNDDSSTELRFDSRIDPVYIRDEVYNLLRRGILDHKYPPGYRFDLPQLEKQWGISRTPISAALHRLEAEGLIEIRPQRGTYVASIDPQEIAESFDIRRVLELYAAEIAVKQAYEREITALGDLVEEMCGLVVDDDIQSVIERQMSLDHQFHARIVSFSRSKRLGAVYEQISIASQMILFQQKFTKADIESANREHRAIFLALEHRDVESLVSRLDEHLKLSKARMMERLGHPLA